MSIQDIIERKGSIVETISASASAKAAADRMREKKIAALIVTDGNTIDGIISEREIVRAISLHGASFFSLRVGEVMSRDLVTAGPGDSVKRAMKLMTQFRARHLPVLRDGALAGIVSIGDVVKNRLEDLELETNVLRDAYLAAH
jgi:CBS domain-containing protein